MSRSKDIEEIETENYDETPELESDLEETESIDEFPLSFLDAIVKGCNLSTDDRVLIRVEPILDTDIPIDYLEKVVLNEGDTEYRVYIGRNAIYIIPLLYIHDNTFYTPSSCIAYRVEIFRTENGKDLPINYEASVEKIIDLLNKLQKAYDIGKIDTITIEVLPHTEELINMEDFVPTFLLYRGKIGNILGKSLTVPEEVEGEYLVIEPDRAYIRTEDKSQILGLTTQELFNLLISLYRLGIIDRRGIYGYIYPVVRENILLRVLNGEGDRNILEKLYRIGSKIVEKKADHERINRLLASVREMLYYPYRFTERFNKALNAYESVSIGG